MVDLHYSRHMLLFYFILIFRPTPTACLGSQARGPIGAVATCLHHSNAGSQLHLQPTRQLTGNAGSLTD